ncbi:MAG TPA: DUF3093 domain-containing protein [Microbacteriaceae bacterium]|nr:DUF3093 domain-containing protein [Microbacteriaceae bacterium]
MYHERVWPPLSWFLISLLIIPAVILALAPINLGLGIVSAVLMYVAIVAFLLVMSPRISVDDGTFRAGRGQIERDFLGEARAISGAERFDALHSGLDARAWLCLRSWTNGLVRVDLTDPADPTPYWLVSTRSPDALVKALNSR